MLSDKVNIFDDIADNEPSCQDRLCLIFSPNFSISKNSVEYIICRPKQYPEFGTTRNDHMVMSLEKTGFGVYAKCPSQLTFANYTFRSLRS